jgi:heme O synthase-like polyprenyltransferase
MMRGSIRLIVGFLLVFGAVGGMDFGPAEFLLYQIAIAVIGLFMMSSGVKAMNRYE